MTGYLNHYIIDINDKRLGINYPNIEGFSLITYNIDLDTETFSQDQTYNNWVSYGVYRFIDNLSIKSLILPTYPSQLYINDWNMGFGKIINNEYVWYNTYNKFPNYFVYHVYDSYIPLSLSMTADKEYVSENKFLGKNGVEIGTLQNNTNLTKDQIKIKTNIWTDISNLELDSNVTNISNIFANRIDLIEIPNINLINITNMENAFYNCINLNERAYSTLTNMLPNANQLTNQYISNIGLDINKFNTDQLNILNIKGYVDAVSM